MLATSFLLAALAAAPALAQAPNTVARSFPAQRTMSFNGTYFFIPVADAKLLELTKPYGLLPVPTADKSLYPNGYPAGTHPVLVYAGFGNDIRQTISGLPAYIPSLLNAQVVIPYVDRTKDGKTPFVKTVAGFISGPDGQTAQGIVPAVVGTLASAFGYPLFVASQDPDNAAYSSIAGGDFSTTVKEVIVPNPVSGPGIYPDALDLLFTSNTASSVSPRAVRAALNQPAYLPSGQCQYNSAWFNETFANPVPRSGNVTLYSPALPSQLTGSTASNGAKLFSGPGVGGFSGTSEMVGFDTTSCQQAAAQAAAASSGYN